jgi:very-short-patch-repair endonuclease
MEEAVVHRSTTLTRDDVRIRDGLPVTAPARTLLDVAGTDLRDEDVARLLDEALHVQRLVRRRELDDLLARAGGHPGAPTLRRVLGKPHRRTESRGERKLLALVRLAGLPEPETQVWLGPHRVDFLWREQRVALEVDAYGTHGSPRRFESDRRRDADRLTRLGIATLRVTEERIDGEPYAVVALLTRAVCGDPR